MVRVALLTPAFNYRAWIREGAGRAVRGWEGTRAGQRSGDRIWSPCSQLNKKQQVAEAAGGGALSSSDTGCFFLLSEQLPCLATAVKSNIRPISATSCLSIPHVPRGAAVSVLHSRGNAIVLWRGNLQSLGNSLFHFLLKARSVFFFFFFSWVMTAFFKIK